MGNVARVFVVNQEMAVLDSQCVHFWPRLGLQQMEIYLFIHFGQIIYHNISVIFLLFPVFLDYKESFKILFHIR